MSYTDVLQEVEGQIVGRQRELEMLLATMLAGEHILLEGAPGTTKSTMLQYVTEKLNLPLYQIEGSADLTPSKLIGTFNPNLVLDQGYKPEFFEFGPLTRAMKEGGVLYIDELNRAAPDATNTLIRAMEEGEIIIPRYGKIKAKSSFRVVAAMNPFDDTGVTRISRALFDRLCRLKMDYQKLDEEVEIVRRRVDAPEQLIQIGCQIARYTRLDDRLRQGSSVRGALDFAKITQSLAELRGSFTMQTLIDAALMAFTGKIWLENPNQTEEDIIISIVRTIMQEIDPSFLKDLNVELRKKKT